MPRFNRTVIQQDVALAASTVTDPIDLPVNPLSHILLTLKGANDTGTLGDYKTLSAFVSFITKIEVLFKGQAIMEGSLQDLMILNALLTGYVPTLGRAIDTDNAQRWATFVLSFSRVLYWAQEAFPATSRGEFQLRITSGSAVTGMDGMFMQIETVELLDVTPARFLKYTTYTGTASATGDNDRDLPRGNPILGTLLFATTVGVPSSGAQTIETVKLLVDNVEQYFPLSNWETLHGELQRRIGGGGSSLGLQGHFHHVPTSVVSVGEDSAEMEFTQGLLENYAYMDYDPLKDNEFALMTEGRGRVAMRINFGATNAMRYIPVELMSVAGAGG